MPQFEYIPRHILDSELSSMGRITQILETNVDSICIAHIEPHDDPSDCICVVFRDTADGVAPLSTTDCDQCRQLVDAIICLASHIVHSRPE